MQSGAGGPVDAQSYGLDLHRPLCSLSPADGWPGRGGQGRDQLFDRVQRSRAELTRLSTPTVDGRLGGGRLDFSGQTAAKRALHGTHVGHPALIESSQKVGIVSIACIDHHRLDRYAPCSCSIEQPQGDLGLRLLSDLLWHLGLFAPLGIVGPGLGQKQLGADWEVKRRRAGWIVGEILGTDHHLAIADFAQRPEYCGATPTEAVPFLGSPVSSKIRMPSVTGCKDSKRLTRASSNASGFQAASVSRCCKRSMLVPAITSAMGSHVLWGKSLSNPVR